MLENDGDGPPVGVPPAGGAFGIRQVTKGEKDRRGDKVDRIFVARSGYVIYEAADNVRVQLSDDVATADKQFDLLAPLFPRRDRLSFLISVLRRKDDYREQIANSFNLALEEQADLAGQLLDNSIQNATDLRAQAGRLGYLVAACAIAGVLMLLLWGAGFLAPDNSALRNLLMSGGAGAAGAVMSIALSIRARTIAPDLNSRANQVDGGLRVLVGVLSGGVVYLMLASSVIDGLVGATADWSAGTVGWQAVLLAGFIAGFLERFVPDLLDKSQPRAPAATGNAAAG